MKLLELLVKELPKRGGWIKEHYQCAQDKTGEVCFYTKGKIHITQYGVWSISVGSEAKHDGFSRVVISLADDYAETIITREQYEAALAASAPKWDGEGLPPVGAEVQCICNQFPSEGQEKLLGKILYSGEYTILHTYKTNEQHHVPVESVLMTKHWSITPIRSEADKKRDAAIEEMVELIDSLSGERANPVHGKKAVAEKFYDAIAAGKIPGVKLED